MLEIYGVYQNWRTPAKVIWSEWRDSNPRPLVPQTSALTGLRYTPTLALIDKAPVRRNAVRQGRERREPRAAGIEASTCHEKKSGPEPLLPHGISRAGFRVRQTKPAVPNAR
jgi:hypothetical protein